jgi:hypothetical protein
VKLGAAGFALAKFEIQGRQRGHGSVIRSVAL